MSLGSDVFNDMQVLDNELRITSGGADETRALRAVNLSLLMFDSVAASMPKVLQTHQNVNTTANQEYTTWPSGLARIDRMYRLDTSQTPNRQVYEIDVIYEAGGQDPQPAWPPLYLALGAQGGSAPKTCYPELDSKLNWGPPPDAVYTVRIYGYWAATALASRSSTFPLPERARLPIASFANRLMAMGLDDPSEELKALAEEVFTPTIRGFKRFTRNKPAPRRYSRMHFT